MSYVIDALRWMDGRVPDLTIPFMLKSMAAVLLLRFLLFLIEAAVIATRIWRKRHA